jgi:hypothetical protein
VNRSPSRFFPQSGVLTPEIREEIARKLKPMNNPTAPPTVSKCSKSYSVQEHHNHSPVGPGTTVELQVIDDPEFYGPGELNIDLTLCWAAVADSGPDQWRISYSERFQVSMHSVREDLVKYCPPTEQVWSTVKKLDLPDNIRAAIEE